MGSANIRSFQNAKPNALWWTGGQTTSDVGFLLRCHCDCSLTSLFSTQTFKKLQQEKAETEKQQAEKEEKKKRKKEKKDKKKKKKKHHKHSEDESSSSSSSSDSEQPRSKKDEQLRRIKMVLLLFCEFTLYFPALNFIFHLLDRKRRR